MMCHCSMTTNGPGECYHCVWLPFTDFWKWVGCSKRSQIATETQPNRKKPSDWSCRTMPAGAFEAQMATQMREPQPLKLSICSGNWFLNWLQLNMRTYNMAPRSVHRLQLALQMLLLHSFAKPDYRCKEDAGLKACDFKSQEPAM